MYASVKYLASNSANRGLLEHHLPRERLTVIPLPWKRPCTEGRRSTRTAGDRQKALQMRMRILLIYELYLSTPKTKSYLRMTKSQLMVRPWRIRGRNPVPAPESRMGLQQECKEPTNRAMRPETHANHPL